MYLGPKKKEKNYIIHTHTPIKLNDMIKQQLEYAL